MKIKILFKVKRGEELEDLEFLVNYDAANDEYTTSYKDRKLNDKAVDRLAQQLASLLYEDEHDTSEPIISLVD